MHNPNMPAGAFEEDYERFAGYGAQIVTNYYEPTPAEREASMRVYQRFLKEGVREERA